MDSTGKSQIAFLKDLPDSTFDGIMKQMKRVHYNKKEYLFMENDPALDVYFILSGTVRLTKSDNLGKEITLSYRKAGDILTCGILLNRERSHYFVSGQMLEPGEVFSLPLEIFDKVLKDTPQFAAKILEVNQNRVLDFTNTITNLACLDKNKALAVELLRLADQHGMQTEEGIVINLRLSHQEIANKIATSREFVSRSISTLSKQNIIKTEHFHVFILDKNYLAQMAK